ncbi:hypothetical protein NC653_005583 [Populus alba x Populus x berolinensis]|uniref:Reticulon-like protein n=1 Tax=Populus alba x Populus x berolinensis TaxID=444605 RepID=A0AAD6RCK3_9ROSI|nr:hypothetical protein NC653_005583 [Populus alba x Populus x berolinensis]
MPEKITAENLISNLVETIADSVPKQKSVSFFEEGEESVTSRINRLFGRQKPVHHLLGGGKSADVLLWRNKKISAGVLTGATAIWVLFEWLNYHLLSLICFALALGMLAQFVWINASGLMNGSVKCFLILLLVVSVPIICDSNFCFINDFSLSQVSISGPSPCTT